MGFWSNFRLNGLSYGSKKNPQLPSGFPKHLPCFDHDPEERSIVSWLQETQVKARLEKFDGLHPTAPGLEDIEKASQLWMLSTTPEHKNYRSILHIPNGCILGAFGSVLTPDNFVLADHTIRGKKLNDFTSVIAQTTLSNYRKNPETLRTIEGRVVCITSLWVDVYFHGLMEVFPRMLLTQLANMPFDKVVFQGANTPFLHEAFSRIGVKPDQLINCGSHDLIQTDELIWPSFVSAPDFPDRDVIDWVRSLFPVPKLPEAAPKKRIYWSRGRKGNPRLVNEAELIPILEEYGFEVYHFTDYTIQQQAEIMSQTSHLLSVHGSGLTNLVFCQPGTVVIEILHSGLHAPVFEVAALKIGLHYVRIRSRFVDPQGKRTLHVAGFLSPRRLRLTLMALDDPTLQKHPLPPWAEISHPPKQP